MLYQKLLMGKEPYFVSVADADSFEVHRHPEIEISYCIEGDYCIVIDNEEYLLKPGELAFVKPMAAHEIKRTGGGVMLTVVIGPGFLGDCFEDFTKRKFDVVVNRHRKDESNQKLIALLDELAYHHLNRSEFSGLVTQGNLFLISNSILQHFSKDERNEHNSKDILEVEKVEKAIQIIYDEYSKKLSIDYVCGQCGYSKSSFCRVFKKVTGETFYDLLNRHRVEIACMHLRESKTAVEDIAVQVGFSDANGFCRAFKTVMGISPGTYRRNSQHNKK